jgi:mRNA interferase MazF
MARLTRPRRGDVYRVALDPTVGTEIRKTRPAVIVSNHSANAFGMRVVVLPVSSNVSSLFPGEALITIAGKPGRALGDQVRSIDRKRLRGRLGTLSRQDLLAVDEALRITLDLP